ncbi:hypothetical protein [Planctobacterium marinum]|uniref:hypothetical protein n=1 Tax=Planctobacterium marinum TaxID=1631968 RepID=UPI001E567093|nr:hypothetical protein [Planctobacterium marinum]MCC2607462.1 hypothetical protein [Planctobacterium marinum]
MWSESLWTKSLIGLLLGFLLSMSLFINIGFAVPIPRDVFLLIAVIGGFTLWSILISWFYSVKSIKKPVLICLAGFLLSALFNYWFYAQGGL